jgi:hypothetical protein
MDHQQVDVVLDIIEDPEPYAAAVETLVEKGGEALEAGAKMLEDAGEYLVDEGGEALSAVADWWAESGDGPILANEAWKAIGKTGEVGEQYLEQLGGKIQQYFDTPYGGRFVDQFVDGIANESKVGYTTLTDSTRLQIFKDVYLFGAGKVDAVNWHFFVSPITGEGGPSQPLQEQLTYHGIGVVLHF